MFDLDAIQKSLREFGLDGWLLYDFRGSNVLARRVLDLESRDRRLAAVLLHDSRHGAAGEAGPPDRAGRARPPAGRARRVYLPWQELEAGIGALVAGKQRSRWNTPPGSRTRTSRKVDAGTIELVRGFGVEVVSSGDLIQQFEATWDDEQWAHAPARPRSAPTSAYDLAWGVIAERVRGGETIRETEVQAAIMDHFQRHGMTTYSPPIVGVGPHSGDPHYEPVAGQRRRDRTGRLRADRPLVQARQAARGVQRPDAGRLRRRDGPGEV